MKVTIESHIDKLTLGRHARRRIDTDTHSTHESRHIIVHQNPSGDGSFELRASIIICSPRFSRPGRHGGLPVIVNATA